jgi:acyl carrier protein
MAKKLTPTEKVIHDFLLSEIVYSRQVRDLAIEDPLLDGLLDSIALMQTVAFLERVFDISIPGEDILPDYFENISAIAQLVERRTAGR